MSTQGVGTFAINSFWESGRLIFYEKAYGHTTTGDVFILGADYVQVGDTANDVNLVWKGDTTGTFTLDAGAHTLVMTGVATSTDGALTITNATESTSTSTGALIVSGGIANAKDCYFGDDVFLTSAAKLDWAAGNVTLTHSTGTLTNSGILVNTGAVSIDDTTESTSTTTGSLHTDGGLGVAKDIYAGDDIFMVADGVINWGAGDVTITGGTNLLTLAGGQLYMAGGVSIVGIKLGSLSSTVPGSGLTVDATTTRGMEVHVDDNNTARATGTQGRAIFGRTMIYADNACEDWGIHGLSKVSGVAKTGNVSAGVVGAFESTGTCSIATGQGNSYFAGVMGRIGGGGTFTITSSNIVGVLSFYNTSTANNFTGTGTVAFMAVASEIAGTGNWDYGLYIKDSVYGIECQAEPTATGRIAKFSGTIDAPNLGDGYGAVEIDTTFTGTYAGISAALSAWVNVTGTGAVGANIVAAQNNGIYADSGANTGSTVIFGMRAQGILTDAPTVFAPFSLNTSNREITALFHMTSNPDVGYRAAATTNSTKVGDVPLFCDGDGTQYFVRVYSAYG